ncbi:hypothetical protein BG003_003091 [Podila horticola]|nr:hypothetical protein BG003_003091 [Podila horticola]
MLSLIRPSSALCAHENNEHSILLLEATDSNHPNSTPSTATTLATSISATPRQRQHRSLHFKPSSTPHSSSSPASASYKDFVAHFTANAPKPYGVIPPRKKKSTNTNTARTRSSSTSLLTTGVAPSPKKPNSPSTPSTPRVSIELQPTVNIPLHAVPEDKGHNTHFQLIQPFFNSLQSFLPEPSTSSSTRLGFWANLKAHCLAATATSFTWTPSTINGPESISLGHPKEGGTFLPPTVLLGPTGAAVPTVGVDATPRSASLTEALLSLPNLAPSPLASRHGSFSYQASSTTYPVSVAAMDRFKPIRSDTIPLKTFTYHETPVVDRPWPVPLPVSLPRQTKTRLTSTKEAKGEDGLLSKAKGSSTDQGGSLPPLPRHLLARETRSNTDYLRMMAAELRMIRSRKLISPLKPRGYLPRRKDPFRNVKSSLCNSIEPSREEDDHPLNNILVGSWSSVSSTDSFLSDCSSGYQTASENFY